MSSVALVVQHALKALSQNLQVAIFAPPFSASDKFDIYIYNLLVRTHVYTENNLSL